MSESINILALMVKDHCKIDELINRLEEVSKHDDYSEFVKAFNKFEWELEKHIFAEEKAIFTSYKADDVNQDYKMLPELTQQHNYIVNKLNNWRDNVRKKHVLNDINEMKEFLVRHRNFEEKEVYPKLDQGLTEDEKRHIIAKINEII